VVEVWRSLYPIAEQFDLVTEDLADLEALLPKLRDEAATINALIMIPPLITAWSRLPPAVKAR
jgi:hypothetical protein